MTDFAFCAYCDHPLSSHDTYGCAKWLPKKHGAKMCSCDWTRRQLLEIDSRPVGVSDTNQEKK